MDNRPLKSFTHAGVTLRYTEDGPPSGPPGGGTLLFLHGFGISSYTWRHIAPALAASHRVLCLDMKGFGASDKPDDPAYTAYDQAALVAAFMEARDMREATVVGCSFGGHVVLELFGLLAGTGRIGRLVLIGGVVPGQRLSAAARVGMMLPPRFALAVLSPAVLKMLMRFVFCDASRIAPEDLAEYGGSLRYPEARRVLLRAAPLIFAPGPNGPVSERLRTIDIPVLIIWGANDALIPVENAHRLAAQIRGSRLVVLPGCGHVPQEERPRETADAIAGFLCEPARSPKRGPL
jgi:pimeloyl-ACP methyl ester carboxylesterase